MAQVVVYNIVKNLIPKLMSIAVNEIGMMDNCRDELKKLEDTLSIIKDVILDADEFQDRSPFVRERIKNLGEFLFDADDLLDEIATEDLRRMLDTRGKMARQVCDFFSSSNNHLDFRRRMGHAVSKIRDGLDFIADDISKFNLISKRVILIRQISGNRERETDYFVSMLDVVIGREKEKNEIIERLIGSGSNTDSVIPIVGIGGLGKTTLAKLVFNDERVVNHFHPRSWVCVSQGFDSKLIVRNILKSISDDNVDGMMMEQLQSLLKRKLEGKRYLIVLDDVWNEDRSSWIGLERRLMIEASGCKIVVTTRIVQVASVMGIDTPYELKGLSDKDSWKLFEQLAFRGGVEKANPAIIEIGKDLIKRCKGIPLSIKALGSTMRSKTSESEWLDIKNNKIWLSSLDEHVLSVLKLRYYQLPTHLKYCFAYCSIFPQDYKIKYEELIQLWMAQGYIQSSSSSDKSLESIGDQYFKDLLSKSFFQEVEFDDYDSITSVKMHDLIHDLANYVSRTNNEGVRHMSLQSDLRELPSLEEKGRRTFFIPDSWYGLKINYSDQGTIISKVKYLRVLDLRSCGIEKVHDSIGSLMQLRYLNLSGNDVIELPDTLSNLLYLQTLNLSGCGRLRELPSGITKLGHLRYLMMDGCDQLKHMPAGIGEMISLQKLSSIVIGEKKRKRGISQPRCGLRDLKDLNDLRGKLSIINLARIGVEDAAEESKEANMKKKTYLHSLILDWEWKSRAFAIEQPRVAELVLEGLQPHFDLKEFSIKRYCGVRFPSWMRTMGNVVKLIFWGCHNCKQLQSLDQLPCLKFLSIGKLKELKYIQEEEEEEEEEEEGGYDNNNNNQVVVTDGGQSPSSSSSLALLSFFPSLQQLQLSDLPKLKGWWRRRGEFVSSSTEIAGEEETYTSSSSSSSSSSEFNQMIKLSIDFCPMLTSMPLHPKLEKLQLSYVNGKLVRERFTTTAEEKVSNHHHLSSKISSSSLPKLKSLRISYLNDLEAIPPEWLQNLTSLESLTILVCRKLASLPCLTSLQLLDISYSPILAERCQKETGEDWPNIAHIPNIIIGDQVIQGRKV